MPTKRRLSSRVLLVLWVACTRSYTMEYITVKTKMGHVRGIVEDVDGVQVEQFLGIPYAEPPTGPLRFRKPVPARSWSPMTLDALQFGNPCAQANGSLPSVPWQVPRHLVDEDCLYLNVWTPLKRSSPRGVLYWVHGGGYRTGTASATLYDSKKLAAVGDIVVVTVNFRIGSFGFLYTGAGTSSGNYLLWDQTLGLIWIRDNIALFGGDPGRVTIYGESAGSIGIGALLLSPRNAGLVHQAIMASGSNYWLIPPQNKVGHAYTDRIAKFVGCLGPSKPSSSTHPEQVLDCLRSVPFEAIIDAEQTQFPEELVTFTPSYGDDYLPQPELTALSRGMIIPLKSIFTGVTTEEGSMFAYFKDPTMAKFGPPPKLSKQKAAEFIGKHYLFFAPKVIQMMINGAYQRPVRGGRDWDGVLESLTKTLGDFIITCPTKFYAETFAKANHPVYFYVFDYRSVKSPWPPWMGATHFEDLQFMFGMPFRYPEMYTDEDRVQSHFCMRVVGSYVNNG